jgi:hypothetical protein
MQSFSPRHTPVPSLASDTALETACSTGTLRPRILHRRRGIALLFVLAVICVTLAISYALSRRSVTASALSRHESGGLTAHSNVETSVTSPLLNLRSNPNWMPATATSSGALAVDERYQVTLAIANGGNERTLDAAAQVYDLADVSATTLSSADRPVADQHLSVRLTKQTRNNLPTSAITAFETAVTLPNDAPVYVAAGNTVRGNVRSKGPIYFQQGFALQGSAKVLGDVSRSGTTSTHYFTYRASWGSTYQAESLQNRCTTDSYGLLHLKNVVLGPTSTNPMGVYCLQGDLVLDENVTINGTLAVQGKLKIRGSGVLLTAIQTLQTPTAAAPSSLVTTAVDLLNTLNPLQLIANDASLSLDPIELGDGSSLKTSFPAIVADSDIEIDSSADYVRISGLVIAGSAFKRNVTTQPLLPCAHNHLLSLDLILNPLLSADGPSVYIRGAIMAGRVHLESQSQRPFALVFDSGTTDVHDAPGFFTWRVADWTDAN